MWEVWTKWKEVFESNSVFIISPDDVLGNGFKNEAVFRGSFNSWEEAFEFSKNF